MTTATETKAYAPTLTEEQRTIITQWVHDLRSGGYEQIRGRLEGFLCEYREDLTDEEFDRAEATGATGFCCLGVLGQQPALTEGTDWFVDTAFDMLTLWTERADLVGKFADLFETSLPAPLIARAGLSVQVPQPCGCGGGEPTLLDNYLIHLNDGECWTFPQIAEMVDLFLLHGQAFEDAYRAALELAPAGAS